MWLEECHSLVEIRERIERFGKGERGISPQPFLAKVMVQAKYRVDERGMFESSTASA